MTQADLLSRLIGFVRCPRCGRVLELDGQMRPLAAALEDLARVATEHADCTDHQPRRRS